MNEDLFNVLKKWRDEIALKLNLKPAYKVLSNKVLKEI
ncbi:MAG: HRDC domain-containing protein, partial [Minisyncoccia bacterium]